MNITIGQTITDTQSFGTVKVLDAYLSPTSGQVAYKVESTEDGNVYLACVEDLEQINDNP